MRGADSKQEGMFSYVSPESRIPTTHLFDSIIAQAHATGLLSDEHFSVDGTLIQAWASNRSYRDFWF